MTTEIEERRFVRIASMRLDAAGDRLKLSAEVWTLIIMGEAKMEDFGPKLQLEIDETLRGILPRLGVPKYEAHQCRRLIEARLRGHTYEAIRAMFGLSSEVTAERRMRLAAAAFAEANSPGS